MKVTVSIRDSENKLSSMQFFRANGATREEDLTNATAIITAVSALIDGVVAGHTVSYDVAGSNSIPAGNVDNEIKAVFGFLTAAGTISRVSVPTFDRTKLLPNSSDVDTEDADVIAFVDAVLAGTDYRNSALDALAYAKEAYGRRQR